MAHIHQVNSVPLVFHDTSAADSVESLIDALQHLEHTSAEVFERYIHHTR